MDSADWTPPHAHVTNVEDRVGTSIVTLHLEPPPPDSWLTLFNRRVFFPDGYTRPAATRTDVILTIRDGEVDKYIEAFQAAVAEANNTYRDTILPEQIEKESAATSTAARETELAKRVQELLDRDE
jgi:hypothetical protein